ncbi:MAG: prepilin-type N-terminal cleavage/methylation domain-containing protein [Xanthomonadales bacterium]|nr:prepilin-type N-terminal cleavage/methylation domain-containing protein [Xanthomonadales bacterium]
MRKPSVRQSGFTLLEVLIAITLLALLMAMAFGSLRTAVGITRSGERTVSITNQTRTVQEFLRRQLSQAMSIPFEVIEHTGENHVFEASPNELRYVGPMPGHLANGGPHVQWITIAGDQLLFDHSQLNGFDPDDPKANNPREPVLLMRGFSEAWFEYRGLDENGEMGEWSRTWDNIQQLPMMARLVVVFDDSNRVWPDLDITILAGSNMASMFGFRRPHMPPAPSDEVLR